MLRLPKTCLAILIFAVALVLSLSHDAAAQDDPNDVPLGDVARNLRRKTPPAKAVIDDDNLSNVMEQAESGHAAGSALKFLMAGDAKGFQISAPDATCSLSFTANAKALLSSQYAQMELPAEEMVKLEGPAAIEGDALTVSVRNRTDWHVSEVSVALTVVRTKSSESALSKVPSADLASPSPFQLDAFAPEAVRPEKKRDLTVIYRMRAAAPPGTMTVFSSPLNLELSPGDEWHWGIVQARGYPPEGRVQSTWIGTAPQDASKSPPADPAPAVVSDNPPPPSPVSLARPQ